MCLSRAACLCACCVYNVKCESHVWAWAYFFSFSFIQQCPLIFEVTTIYYHACKQSRYQKVCSKAVFVVPYIHLHASRLPCRDYCDTWCLLRCNPMSLVIGASHNTGITMRFTYYTHNIYSKYYIIHHACVIYGCCTHTNATINHKACLSAMVFICDRARF